VQSPHNLRRLRARCRALTLTSPAVAGLRRCVRGFCGAGAVGVPPPRRQRAACLRSAFWPDGGYPPVTPGHKPRLPAQTREKEEKSPRASSASGRGPESPGWSTPALYETGASRPKVKILAYCKVRIRTLRSGMILTGCDAWQQPPGCGEGRIADPTVLYRYTVPQCVVEPLPRGCCNIS